MTHTHIFGLWGGHRTFSFRCHWQIHCFNTKLIFVVKFLLSLWSFLWKFSLNSTPVINHKIQNRLCSRVVSKLRKPPWAVHIKRRCCSDFCIFIILTFVFVYFSGGFVWICLPVCVLSSSLPLSYSQRVSLSLYWEPNKRYLEFWKEPLVGLLLSHSLKNTASLPLACWISWSL